MSRFYTQISSSEDESSDDDGQQLNEIKRHIQVSSDSEEEEKRVVRSVKDKRFEEMTTIVKNMKNHKKIKDTTNVLADFEELIRALDKWKKVVEAEGIPKFYIKAIAELEEFVNEVWEFKRTLNKQASRSLGVLRQRVKKYNRDYEDKIADFKENPDKYEEVSDVEEPEKTEAKPAAPESDGEVGVETSKPGKAAAEADEETDSDEMWGSSSDDDSSSSEDDEAYRLDPAARFLKTGDKSKDKDKKRDRPAKPSRTTTGRKKDETGDDGGVWVAVEGGREKARVFDKNQEITTDLISKKLNEIMSLRGKRGTDRYEQEAQLAEVESKILENEFGLGFHTKVLIYLISAVFDHNMNQATSMHLEVWNKNILYIKKLMSLLEDNLDELTINEMITEENEILDTSPYRIQGCIVTIVERMDDEYTKILQNVDPHSVEYIERLQDEVQVCELIDRLCTYLDKKQSGQEDMCRAYIRKVEHLYYKFDYEWARKVETEGNTELAPSFARMEKYCHYIYHNDSTNRIRTRAILCHIYYLALHDYWFKARDIMLMSNLQASIEQADIPTQILYNRSMVQLGLCAFRQGFIRDAHLALVDMQSSGRAKELLAQGLIPARVERPPDQEKLEKRRQVPYHMHINLELLECVYLVSALLNEISFIAAHEMDLRRRMISKNFHHVLKISERQTLVGPPETMREHIVAASKTMRTGDWKSTVNFIINEKMNGKVWDLFFQSDKVKTMLVQKIKEEALRIYLFTYSSVYESIGLDRLGEHFELEKAVVHSVVSKMILNADLMASLDEPSQCMVMHKTEPSRMQVLALQLAEKVNNLADLNERLADQKITIQTPQKGGNYTQQQQQSSNQHRQRQNNRYYSNTGGQKRDHY